MFVEQGGYKLYILVKLYCNGVLLVSLLLLVILLGLGYECTEKICLKYRELLLQGFCPGFSFC